MSNNNFNIQSFFNKLERIVTTPVKNKNDKILVLSAIDAIFDGLTDSEKEHILNSKFPDKLIMKFNYNFKDSSEKPVYFLIQSFKDILYLNLKPTKYTNLYSIEARLVYASKKLDKNL